MPCNDPSTDQEALLLSRVYALILSWPVSEDEDKTTDRGEFGDQTQSEAEELASQEPEQLKFATGRCLGNSVFECGESNDTVSIGLGND